MKPLYTHYIASAGLKLVEILSLLIARITSVCVSPCWVRPLSFMKYPALGVFLVVMENGLKQT